VEVMMDRSSFAWKLCDFEQQLLSVC
jgi:hypothetical protein